MTEGHTSDRNGSAQRPPQRAQPAVGDQIPRRRPLPAVICLVALTLLTALVWWRVLQRDSGSHAATPTSCPTVTAHTLPQPIGVSVTVLNSTTRTGIAKSTATALTKLGFTVSGYANDTVHLTGVGEIRYGTDQKDAATLLGYYFPGATQVALGANSASKLVISLGAQFKAVQTEAQVQAAMQAAHVSVAPRSVTTAPSSPGC